MSESRFFTDAACSPKALVDMSADDSHHVLHVLRLREGDAIVMVHDGVAWDAAIASAARDSVRAQIEGKRDEAGGELPVAITVIQALTKGAKFDDVVEKVVELGARRIVPAICERSSADVRGAKLERWRRIARAAAQQSRRRFLPVVTSPEPWASAVASTRPTIVAYEAAARGSFERAARDVGKAPEIAIAVGPEGGLSEVDVEAARVAGAALVSLGPTILRTETAAAAMLAALASTAGWW